MRGKKQETHRKMWDMHGGIFLFKNTLKLTLIINNSES